MIIKLSVVAFALLAPISTPATAQSKPISLATQDEVVLAELSAVIQPYGFESIQPQIDEYVKCMIAQTHAGKSYKAKLNIITERLKENLLQSFKSEKNDITIDNYKANYLYSYSFHSGFIKGLSASSEMSTQEGWDLMARYCIDENAQ